MNQPLLEQIEASTEPVMVVRVEEAEMDEMWRFVKPKKQQRWLWSAIDHRTGQMLILSQTAKAARLRTTGDRDR